MTIKSTKITHCVCRITRVMVMEGKEVTSTNIENVYDSTGYCDTHSLVSMTRTNTAEQKRGPSIRHTEIPSPDHTATRTGSNPRVGPRPPRRHRQHRN
ncbi:hypothetical protein GWI33_020945 [Rhynchophorus ferrugineus]|uniref:Uncharacterized protein n=1 Tax=Rhynchophorus ferrugineus TaxID=354439 RepID=A0A834M2X0_RHYFE|nr:hypothetical protein GWI33_020945 [Rhynchophorus ferrugineus]